MNTEKICRQLQDINEQMRRSMDVVDAYLEAIENKEKTTNQFSEEELTTLRNPGMNEYEVTHTPKVCPVNELAVDMNPKHDRGLCAICQSHSCWNCWNNPNNIVSKTITATI